MGDLLVRRAAENEGAGGLGMAGGGVPLVGAVHNSGRMVGLPVVRRRGGVMLRVFLSCEPERRPRRAGLDRLDQRRGGVSTGSTSGRGASWSAPFTTQDGWTDCRSCGGLAG